MSLYEALLGYQNYGKNHPPIRHLPPKPVQPRYHWLTVSEPEGMALVERDKVLQGLAGAKVYRDGEVLRMKV